MPEFDILKDLSSTLGPGAAVFFAYLWYIANKERREKDRQLLNLSTAGTKALTGASASIDAAERAIEGLRSDIKSESKSTRKSVYDLRDKVGELGKVRRGRR